MSESEIEQAVRNHLDQSILSSNDTGCWHFVIDHFGSSSPVQMRDILEILANFGKAFPWMALTRIEAETNTPSADLKASKDWTDGELSRYYTYNFCRAYCSVRYHTCNSTHTVNRAASLVVESREVSTDCVLTINVNLFTDRIQIMSTDDGIESYPFIDVGHAARLNRDALRRSLAEFGKLIPGELRWWTSESIDGVSATGFEDGAKLQVSHDEEET